MYGLAPVRGRVCLIVRPCVVRGLCYATCVDNAVTSMRMTWLCASVCAVDARADSSNRYCTEDGNEDDGCSCFAVFTRLNAPNRFFASTHRRTPDQFRMIVL